MTKLLKLTFIVILLNLVLIPLGCIDNINSDILLSKNSSTPDSVLINLYNKGFKKFRVSDPVKAINYLTMLANIYESQGNLTEKYYRYNEIGQIYHRLGMHQLALEYLLTTSDFLLKIDDKISSAWLYSDIGNVYYAIKQYDIAEPYYEEGLKMMRKENHLYGQSVMLNNIALCNVQKGNIKESFKNFEEALNLRKQTDNIYSVYHSKFLIANNYALIGDNEHAIELYSEIWDNNNFDKERYDEARLLKANTGLALFMYYTNQKDYSTAEKYLATSIEMMEDIGDYHSLAHALSSKAEYYRKLNRKTEAIEILEKIFDYSLEHQILVNAHNYSNKLVTLNLEQHNIAESEKYFNYYKSLTDTLLATRSSENLVKLHSIVQNHLKKVENENLLKQHTYFLRLLFISFIFFFIVLFLISYIYFKNKRNYKKIKDLANASSEGIVIHDRGVIIDYNDQFVKMVGKSEKGLIGQNLLDFSDNEDNEDLQNVLKACEKAETETKILGADNQLIDVKFASRPYVYKRKEVGVAVIQDRTRVNQYINSIIETQKQLKVINTTKDRLFSIIGHDLKNPFNAIIGFSNLMKESWKELDPADVDEMLTMINESSISAHSLLENLLDWARIQTGQFNLKASTFKLSQAIDEAVTLLSTSIKMKQLNIKIDCDDDILMFADFRMMSTIIRNLITNSIKFTHLKGTIKVTCFEDANSTTLIVEDDGTGMTKEKLENLFKIDKFNSSEGTNHEKGTGLGLVLCKDLVELQNGEISIESELDLGSKFIVVFPRQNR